jgi:hypothetical protein
MAFPVSHAQGRSNIIPFTAAHLLFRYDLAFGITVYLYQTTTATLGPSRVNAYIYLTPALVALLLFLLDATAIPMAIVPGILISIMATVILQCNSTKPSGQKEKAPTGNRAGL